jgi:hypothetical protein
VRGPVLQTFSFDPAHPYAAGERRGIAIGAAAGAPVAAPASGAVSFAGTVPASGKTVTILTPAGLAVTLTHLGSIGVEKSAAVAEGAVVGTVGPSGTPELDVPYVHLGIRDAANEQGYLDPLAFLPPPSAPAAPPAPAPAPAPVPVPVPVPVAPAPAPPVAAPAAPPVAVAAPAPSPAPPVSAPAPAQPVTPSAPATAPAPVPAAAPAELPPVSVVAPAARTPHAAPPARPAATRQLPVLRVVPLRHAEPAPDVSAPAASPPASPSIPAEPRHARGRVRVRPPVHAASAPRERATTSRRSTPPVSSGDRRARPLPLALVASLLAALAAAALYLMRGRLHGLATLRERLAG